MFKNLRMTDFAFENYASIDGKPFQPSTGSFKTDIASAFTNLFNSVSLL